MCKFNENKTDGRIQSMDPQTHYLLCVFAIQTYNVPPVNAMRQFELFILFNTTSDLM